MWWTSRASPDSTTSATFVRDFCRTRCWWTAEVSSREGIGARSAVECRSDSMITRAPFSMASSVSARHRSMAAAKASPPPATSYSPEMVAEANPGRLPSAFIPINLARSSLSSTGKGSTICRQDRGPGASRFCSGPITEDSEVTTASRIASSGGLVTCANSWEK